MLGKSINRLTGKEFKQHLLEGQVKLGLFINSGSPVVAEQLSHSSYDWLLVDAQHSPISSSSIGPMLSGIATGHAKSLVRVGGWNDRIGIQQSLDQGADGILIPYVNNKAEAQEAINCCLYPEPSKHQGSRSVYFPQRSMNEAGLLGYAGTFNGNVLKAVQIETADSITNIDEILSIPELDIAFLGKNDLAMSMGLYEKYTFPDMYSCPEMNEAIDKLLAACKKYNKIAGIFLFGTDGVEEHLKKGFNFISVGNDLHHILTANTQFVKKVKELTESTGHKWVGQESSLIQ